MRISVVLPVLEDRGELRATLPCLAGAREIIVVDASAINPVAPSDLPAQGRLIRVARAGRAHQQNVGARAATGEVVLFLHADTRLPADALDSVRRALCDPEVIGGGFARTFDSPSRFLRWSCQLATWRSKLAGWFLGDQAIFVRRSEFLALGGFRWLRVFEDYDLCRRLRTRGRLRCLGPAVWSSARRFVKGGPVRRSARDLLLTCCYLAFGPRFFEDPGNEK